LPSSVHSYLQVQRDQFEQELLAEQAREQPDLRRIDRLREFRQAILADLRVQLSLGSKSTN
jgi:hypothetical protein